MNDLSVKQINIHRIGRVSRAAAEGIGASRFAVRAHEP